MQYYQMTGFMGITDQPAEAVGDFKLPDPDQSALYLDFDGTLVEIAERPDDIDVTATITGILDRAMERLDGRVALVSGRSIADLQKFLPDFKGALIGTHGAEMHIDGVHSKLPECVGKDIALTRLMDRLPFRGKTPIYAGDDLTDEPALQLVERRKGYAIKIGEAETVASHRLPDPKSLLLKLEDWLV